MSKKILAVVMTGTFLFLSGYAYTEAKKQWTASGIAQVRDNDAPAGSAPAGSTGQTERAANETASREAVREAQAQSPGAAANSNPQNPTAPAAVKPAVPASQPQAVKDPAPLDERIEPMSGVLVRGHVPHPYGYDLMLKWNTNGPYIEIRVRDSKSREIVYTKLLDREAMRKNQEGSGILARTYFAVPKEVFELDHIYEIDIRVQNGPDPSQPGFKYYASHSPTGGPWIKVVDFGPPAITFPKDNEVVPLADIAVKFDKKDWDHYGSPSYQVGVFDLSDNRSVRVDSSSYNTIYADQLKSGHRYKVTVTGRLSGWNWFPDNRIFSNSVTFTVE